MKSLPYIHALSIHTYKDALPHMKTQENPPVSKESGKAFGAPPQPALAAAVASPYTSMTISPPPTTSLKSIQHRLGLAFPLMVMLLTYTLLPAGGAATSVVLSKFFTVNVVAVLKKLLLMVNVESKGEPTSNCFEAATG